MLQCGQRDLGPGECVARLWILLVMGVRPLIYSDWVKVVDVFRKVILLIFSCVGPGDEPLNSYKVHQPHISRPFGFIVPYEE